ncbi:hypothetical protein AALP_AA3G003800 [Arabis alpina]|uniref:CRM domain-containing protein n=1 Tax=Arabis alpina TaxID=50452 RepID=A0A087H645_ARAAL|nr:hypothetical protein AALP_AA3G003800 [Arabis alpina]
MLCSQGRRGVFDGTIENMHLHWKYRELVKIIFHERSIEAAYEVAEILEVESGGILVAVEMVSKGYAVIVYRGKNYERPSCLRPQTLLSKREALKRSVEAQRRKSLKLHVLKLSNNIDELNRQLVGDSATNEARSDGESSNIMVQEETENQHIEPEKSREEFEHGSSSDSSILSSGEENWEDDSEDEESQYTTSSQAYEEDESGSGSSQRDEGNSLDSTANIPVLAETSFAEASSFPDRSMPRNSFVNAERKVPTGQGLRSSTRSGSQISPLREKENDGLVTDLSNRERLILRKQALKMKKRPPFAVGRSNVVTGLAKTLKMHFQRNPLAIVNVKGRANGTSVQEVVAKLKEETGALLVSQEPSKVILYRGWGAEEEMKSFYPNKNVKNSINLTSSQRFVADPPAVSPALIEAIKLECGL